MPKMFHDLVCVPLKKYVKKMAKKHLSSLRRLESWTSAAPDVPELSPLIKSWWSAHPGDRNGKLAITTMLLDELDREVDRLLVSMPQAAIEAHEAEGLEAALHTVRSHLPRSAQVLSRSPR